MDIFDLFDTVAAEAFYPSVREAFKSFSIRINGLLPKSVVSLRNKERWEIVLRILNRTKKS